MIRIFYDSENDTPENSLSSGQMVLYSKNGVFHIFRFVSGGLEKLTDLLKGCQFLRETNQEIEQASPKQVTFVVYAPRLGLKELHPSEREVQTQLNKETWDDLHDREGRITALKLIQKVRMHADALLGTHMHLHMDTQFELIHTWTIKVYNDFICLHVRMYSNDL